MRTPVLFKGSPSALPRDHIQCWHSYMEADKNEGLPEGIANSLENFTCVQNWLIS